MDRHHRKLVLSSALLLSLPLALGNVFAAKSVELRHQKMSFLQSFSSGLATSSMTIQELNRSFDRTDTLHVRIQEMYNGYPVWGADAVVHIPNANKFSRTGVASLLGNKDTTMNGTFYADLEKDLAKTSPVVFTEAQKQKALRHAIADYQQKVGGKSEIMNQESNLMVYIDHNEKAHYAFKVNFDAMPVKRGDIPAQPIYIMDADSFQIYDEWNDIKTVGRDDEFGGGYGGNKKMGKLVYDGLKGNYEKLSIKRDAGTATCYLQNAEVTIHKCLSVDFRGMCRKTAEFTTPCAAKDPAHNNVYWNGETDAVNGGFSPSNDALFNGAIIKHMYLEWYKTDVLTKADKKTPMMLDMVVHLPIDNAYWFNGKMNFGDGVSVFYPLTSLGVAAHEVSHGFTEQHSNLVYKYHSGGMNEAFSDMAAQAAEVYAFGVGKNSWQIGPEIFVKEGEALRYMDKPSKDCKGKKPGPTVRCSLDDATQYSCTSNDPKDPFRTCNDPHYSSGVYNLFFHTLANSKGWDVQNAFGVMVEANAHYWTTTATFDSGACGVLDAAKKLGYDDKAIDAIKAAFDKVKVKYKTC